MTKIINTAIIICFSLVSFAQQNIENKSDNQTSEKQGLEIKTLFGKDKISHGAYLGLSFGYADLNKKDAIVGSARLAWVIDHCLALGLSASGFSEDFWSDVNNSYKSGLSGGYFGFVIEPIVKPTSPVHVSFPIMSGFGGVTLVKEYNWNNYTVDYYNEDFDAFFIIEPAVEIEANLIKHIRANIFVSHRFTSPIYLKDTKRYALNGFSAGIGLKIGKF